jgi:hypothetical protein
VRDDYRRDLLKDGDVESNPGPGKGKGKAAKASPSRPRAIAPAGRVEHGVPRFSRTVGSDGITIESSSLVGYVHRSINGSYTTVDGGALIAGYNLNPRNAAILPWLSHISDNYDEASFDYLDITLVPTCGGLATGSLMVAFDPDSTDVAPQSLGDMSRMQSKVGSASSGPVTLRIRPSGVTRWTYTGQGPTVADRFTSWGKLFVASEGVHSTEMNVYDTRVAQLWVKYRVKLRHPEMTTVDVAEASTFAVNSQTLTDNIPAAPQSMFRAEDDFTVVAGELPVACVPAGPSLGINDDGRGFEFDQPGEYRVEINQTIDAPAVGNLFPPITTLEASTPIYYWSTGVEVLPGIPAGLGEVVAQARRITYDVVQKIKTITYLYDVVTRQAGATFYPTVTFASATAMSIGYKCSALLTRRRDPLALTYTPVPALVENHVPDVVAAARACRESRRSQLDLSAGKEGPRPPRPSVESEFVAV